MKGVAKIMPVLFTVLCATGCENLEEKMEKTRGIIEKSRTLLGDNEVECKEGYPDKREVECFRENEEGGADSVLSITRYDHDYHAISLREEGEYKKSGLTPSCGVGSPIDFPSPPKLMPSECNALREEINGLFFEAKGKI